MTIKKKIQINEKELEKRREKFIAGGGTVSSDSKKKEWLTICLRLTPQLLKEVDHYASKRVGLSRTAWILEAIQEKIENM